VIRILSAVVIFYIVLATAIWVFLAPPAAAHSWYDQDCCNTMDCAPVSLEDVQGIIDIGPAGIRVTIRPGDHPLFPDAHGTRFFPRDAKGRRESQDDDWHVSGLMYQAHQPQPEG
jgi:hypothetical protein